MDSRRRVGLRHVAAHDRLTRPSAGVVAVRNAPSASFLDSRRRLPDTLWAAACPRQVAEAVTRSGLPRLKSVRDARHPLSAVQADAIIQAMPDIPLPRAADLVLALVSGRNTASHGTIRP
jgi:hypothetical protein